MGTSLKSPKLDTYYEDINQFYLECFTVAANRQFEAFRPATHWSQREVRCGSAGRSKSDEQPRCTWFIKLGDVTKKKVDSTSKVEIISGTVIARCTQHSCQVEDPDAAGAKMELEVKKFAILLENMAGRAFQENKDDATGGEDDIEIIEQEKELEEYESEEMEQGEEYPNMTDKISIARIAAILQNATGPMPVPSQSYAACSTLIFDCIAAVKSQGFNIARSTIVPNDRVRYVCKERKTFGCLYTLVLRKGSGRSWYADETEFEHDHLPKNALPPVQSSSRASTSSSLNLKRKRRIEDDQDDTFLPPRRPPPLTQERLLQHTRSLPTPSPSLHQLHYRSPSLVPLRIDSDTPIAFEDLNNLVHHILLPTSSTYPFAKLFWDNGVNTMKSLLHLVTMEEEDLNAFFDEIGVSTLIRLLFVGQLITKRKQAGVLIGEQA